MDQVLKSLDIRGNISTRLRQECAYADDILIIARMKQALTDSFIKLNEEVQKAGLVINTNKTNSLKCTRNQVKGQIVDLGGVEIGNVQSFKYLGSMVNTNNTIEEEIKERLSTGNKAYFAHKMLFMVRHFQRNLSLNSTIQ
jgi:hypothetical protein